MAQTNIPAYEVTPVSFDIDELFSFTYTQNYQLNGLSKPILYPNPLSDSFKIRFAQKLQSVPKIDIYDIRGRKIDTKAVFSGRDERIINCNLTEKKLPNGIYLYKVTAGRQTYQGKIMILH